MLPHYCPSPDSPETSGGKSPDERKQGICRRFLEWEFGMIAGKASKRNEKRKQIGDYLAAFGLRFGVYYGYCWRDYTAYQLWTFYD